MIRFSALIAAIQKAAEQAAKAVADENLNILRTYFQSSKSGSAALEECEPDTNRAVTLNDFEHLTPRMVVMKYPRETSAGPVEHHVMVPLLSLSPISNIQLSDMSIEMDLEIVEEDGEIMVGFPHQKKTLFGGDKVVSGVPNAKVTIKIATAETRPRGVEAVIEGYDKALRAQIPS